MVARPAHCSHCREEGIEEQARPDWAPEQEHDVGELHWIKTQCAWLCWSCAFEADAEEQWLEADEREQALLSSPGKAITQPTTQDQ